MKQFWQALLGVFILFLVIKLFNISFPLTIVSTSRTDELAVVGEGKIDIVPDTAYVNAGISVRNAATAEEAKKGIDSVNNKIIQQLKSLGFKSTDIKTTNYSISPNYSTESSTKSTVQGYDANASLNVKIRNTELVSKVIETMVQAGANDVSQAYYAVDDPNKYREQARKKAIQNAKEQAQKLASDLGINLGKVTNIIESNPQPLPLVQGFRQRAMATADSSSAQVEPGTQTITSEVTLYFEKQ